MRERRLLLPRPGGVRADHVVRLEVEEVLVLTVVVRLDELSRLGSASGKRAVRAYDLSLLMDRPVTSACLVLWCTPPVVDRPASDHSSLADPRPDLAGPARGPLPADRLVSRSASADDASPRTDAMERRPGTDAAAVVDLLLTSRRTAHVELQRCHAERMVLTYPWPPTTVDVSGALSCRLQDPEPPKQRL